MLNPWKILDVHRKSTDRQIYAAYIKAAKKHHPDMKKGNRDKFDITVEAYRAIRDRKARGDYITKVLYSCKPCEVCRGDGVKSSSKGLTEKTYTACEACSGSGFTIKAKGDKNVVIKL